MPTYQYACTECGHAFEQVQSFTEDSLTTCPECQGRLRKLYNAVGVVFKGSGFYRTDSRAADGKGSGSGEQKSETKTETKSDSKTESKPAAKSDSSSSSSSSSSSAGSKA
ncbi:FmdB family zinc ribbon protein [Nocardioides litoris]|uniref:FmdB family zinc ribbon protein n=1 Tax=Nocardioides litoris TaxID=1926648 RepID=UPI001121D65B|nr:FmdB family zinc ribbon protein [Nocardioides litoris]